MEIASSGQSYHPEFHAHQDVVAQAYAEQLEQEERRENQFAGLNSGISDETLQFLDRSTSVLLRTGIIRTSNKLKLFSRTMSSP